MSDVIGYSPVQPGDVLADRYVIERVLGVGGMGVVVAARHRQLDALVAIKFLLPHVLMNTEAVARFAREARAAVRIKSEHVTRVSDVGTLDNGAPYMVMEHLEGVDLSALLRTRGRLGIDDALDFVLQASEAVAEAHSLGIVHRDLKPANLFLSQRADGSQIVKVLDFGISKSIGLQGSAAKASMSATSGMLGSPVYMSPEQLNSARDIDARTDVWALGVILYELLIGRPPFEAETLPQLFLAILERQPQRPRMLRPDIPPSLEAVMGRCLEKDRTRRFASVGEMASALSEVAPPGSRLSIERILRISSLPMPASQSGNRPVLNLTAAPSERGLSTLDAWGHTSPSSRRGRRWALVTVPAALVLASAAGLFWWRSRSALQASATNPPGVDATLATASGAVAAPVVPPPTAMTPEPPPPEPAAPPDIERDPPASSSWVLPRFGADPDVARNPQRRTSPRLRPAPARSPSSTAKQPSPDEGWVEDRK